MRDELKRRLAECVEANEECRPEIQADHLIDEWLRFMRERGLKMTEREAGIWMCAEGRAAGEPDDGFAGGKVWSAMHDAAPATPWEGEDA